jgi:hypothetical protein
MTTDTPRTDAMQKRYITVVYEITDENEWRKTNPLRYAHNGLNAVRVCADDACELLDEAEAEVEGLKKWRDNLISNLMALEIYKHNHWDDPAVALAAYGQWNWKAGEWEAQAEVERLKEMVMEAARKGDELLEPYRLRAEKAETLLKQIQAFAEALNPANK